VRVRDSGAISRAICATLLANGAEGHSVEKTRRARIACGARRRGGEGRSFLQINRTKSA